MFAGRDFFSTFASRFGRKGTAEKESEGDLKSGLVRIYDY
jgi:hypothetical protein